MSDMWTVAVKQTPMGSNLIDLLYGNVRVKRFRFMNSRDIKLIRNHVQKTADSMNEQNINPTTKTEFKKKMEEMFSDPEVNQLEMKI